MQDERPYVSKPDFMYDADYRRAYARDGTGLGTREYPNNREGRRKLARSWRGYKSPQN